MVETIGILRAAHDFAGLKLEKTLNCKKFTPARFPLASVWTRSCGRFEREQRESDRRKLLRIAARKGIKMERSSGFLEARGRYGCCAQL
jgi:hypothetical protein